MKQEKAISELQPSSKKMFQINKFFQIVPKLPSWFSVFVVVDDVSANSMVLCIVWSVRPNETAKIWTDYLTFRANYYCSSFDVVLCKFGFRNWKIERVE